MDGENDQEPPYEGVSFVLWEGFCLRQANDGVSLKLEPFFRAKRISCFPPSKLLIQN